MSALQTEGSRAEVQGSAKKPYVLENKGGVYSCSCPSWRNQSTPIEMRTCKHLRQVLGDEHESTRTSTLAAEDKPNKATAPPCMLAHQFDPGKHEVDGWLWSEKLDGVRGWWTGKEFLSRAGNVFHAPPWFTERLPQNMVLDGELYMGRQKFQDTLSVVKRLKWDERWREVRYVVFDAPTLGIPFEQRLMAARYAVGVQAYATVLEHFMVHNTEDVFRHLKTLTDGGAEGLMLRKPGSAYEVGRSHLLLKVKPFKDAEATVIGYEPGKGRHKGRLGALTVALPNGVTFEIGTGLTDADRDTPPPLMTKITFRYTELTKDGVPKCASYLRPYEAT